MNKRNMPTEAEIEAQLAELRKMDENDIDTSEIRVLPKDRDALDRSIKRAVAMRIDADVFEWLRARSEPYQTRINIILREAMERATRSNGSEQL